MSLLTLLGANLGAPALPTVRPGHAFAAGTRVRDFAAIARFRNFTASPRQRGFTAGN